MVNSKRPLSFVNRTNYFNPSVSSTLVRLSSPNTYSSRQSKIEGYESRLYYQFEECKKNGMPVYFYTLTYNDRALPDFFGVPCFDYEDLRDLFTGGFRKQLRRKYGVTFKYFVGAELGDGKGSRGLQNNPHYHVLFFLESCPFSFVKYSYEDVCIGKYVRRSKYHNVGDDKFKRVRHKTTVVVNSNPPSPTEFRHLVRLYWQGFDQDVVGKIPFQDAKYGIAQEGLFCGLVSDFRACCYCAKYVCKDVRLKAFEESVCDLIRDNYLSSVPRGEEESPFLYDAKVDEYVRLSLNEYRNRFCNKCRISNGVGDYALEFIDVDNPYLLIPQKKDYKHRPISLYYYRKLFQDVVKDVNGQNLYVLNQLGIDYKVSQLEKRLCKLSEKTENFFRSLIDNPSLYSTMVESDVNVDVDFDFSEFKLEYDLLDGESKNRLFRAYSEYKLVYQDRFFEIPYDRHSVFFCQPRIDVVGDYRRFLSPSFYNSPFVVRGAFAFLEDMPSGWFSYSTHKYFSKFLRFFALFDLCSDYFFIQKDNKLQSEAIERENVKRFYVKRKLNFDYVN